MKKKLIFLLSVLILITIALTGCNWLPGGLINVFDPEAQLRVSYSDITGDTISLEVYSLNKVGFNGEGFSCKYYSNDILIPDLMKTVGTPFRVEPSDTSGTPGPITTIGLLLYSQEVQKYMTSNPSAEMTCTISLIGTDDAGHDILKSITVSLPALSETEPEPDEILQANVIITNLEQSLNYARIYYEIENTGSIDIDSYQIWFTVKCTDDSEYTDWTVGLDLKIGDKRNDFGSVDIGEKTAESVKIKNWELTNYDF